MTAALFRSPGRAGLFHGVVGTAARSVSLAVRVVAVMSHASGAGADSMREPPAGLVLIACSMTGRFPDETADAEIRGECWSMNLCCGHSHR